MRDKGAATRSPQQGGRQVSKIDSTADHVKHGVDKAAEAAKDAAKATGEKVKNAGDAIKKAGK